MTKRRAIGLEWPRAWFGGGADLVRERGDRASGLLAPSRPCLCVSRPRHGSGPDDRPSGRAPVLRRRDYRWEAFAPESRDEIDARVLQNTVEQLVLALCLWPPTAYLLAGDGPGVAVALGIGFCLARLAFWVGYHRAPSLRAFGFAATFYPTVMALAWAVLSLVLG